MVRVEARLRAEEAAMLLQALDVARRLAWRDAASSHDCSGDRDGDGRAVNDSAANIPAETLQRHPALSRADALVAVAEAFLAAAARGDGRGVLGAVAAPVELVVHVDASALRADTGTSTARTDGHNEGAGSHEHDPTQRHATLADGTALSIATAQRLACDAAVATVAHDAAGRVTTTSRRTRRVSSTLRRALRSRDGGCRFPGCTNLLTDAHHVVAWAHGGVTTLRNLCSLCRRHHRLVHEHGYQLETAADGELRFFRRDGTPVPLADEHRLPLDAARDAVAALRDTHAGCGLVIDASTAFPRWDGEPVDYALAVDALLADEQRVQAASAGRASDLAFASALCEEADEAVRLTDHQAKFLAHELTGERIMNPRPIEEARTPLLALALPALRRARRRAEEIARSTRTALVFAEGGHVVSVRPEDGTLDRPHRDNAER